MIALYTSCDNSKIRVSLPTSNQLFGGDNNEETPPGSPAPVTSLTVEVNQAINETIGACTFTETLDPSTTAGNSFKISFSELIDPTTFDISDISNSGTGGSLNLNWNLIDCGDNQNFQLIVNTIEGDGSVIPTIAANSVDSVSGYTNSPSTGSDSSITYVNTSLNVTIERAVTKSIGSCTFGTTPSTTNSQSLEYEVTFNAPIDPSTFTVSDIINNGTGGTTTLNWSLSNCGSNTHFKLQSTAIVGQGTIIPSLPASSVQTLTLKNNTPSISTNNIVIFDSIAPSMTIAQRPDQDDPTGGAPVRFDVQFSEPIDITSFSSLDIVVDGTSTNTVGSWNIINTGDNQNFIIEAVSIGPNGTISPKMTAGVVRDLAGNFNTSPTYGADNIVTVNNSLIAAPTIASSHGVNASTNSLPVEFLVSFNTVVDQSTLSTSDIVQNGSVTGITWEITDTGDGKNFILKALTASNDGTVVPSINANSVKSLGGQDFPSSIPTGNGNSVRYDTTAPTVTFSQRPSQQDPTATTPVIFDVVFNEPIDPATFTSDDIYLNSGASAYVSSWAIVNSGDDQNFTLRATSVGTSGTIIPNMQAGKIYDKAGNSNLLPTYGADNQVTFDNAGPFVVINQHPGGIIGSCPNIVTQVDPTNSQSINYLITFSKQISNATFTIDDISNIGTGGSTALVWNITSCADQRNYLLTTSSISGGGTIWPKILANTIQDTLGNFNNESSSSDGSVLYSSLSINPTIDQHPGGVVGTCPNITTQADPVAALDINYLLTFDNPIDPSSLTASDIVNTGTGGSTALTWNITSCGDNLNFLVSATTVTGDGTIQPTLLANTVNDIAGNINLPSSSTDNSVLYDVKGPEVSIEIYPGGTYGDCALIPAQEEITRELSLKYLVQFDEVILPETFDLSDISNAGSGGSGNLSWSITNCGDNMTFLLEAIAIEGDGFIQPTIGANLVEDIFNNLGSASTSINNSIYFDITSPSVAIEKHPGGIIGSCPIVSTQVSFTNDPSVNFLVTFSEEILTSSFTSTDIRNMGTAGAGGIDWSITNCGDNRNFLITTTSINGGGTIIPIIDRFTVYDPYFNRNLQSTSVDNIVKYDQDIPTLTISKDITQANPASIEPLRFRVTFSEEIDATSFTTSDIQIASGSTITASTITITNTGDNTTFIVNLSGLSGEGTIGINIAAGLIQDYVGFTNSAATLINHMITIKNGWYQEAFIKSSNSDIADNFGYSADISGDTLVVGAPKEDSNQTTITNGASSSSDNSSADSGAVYVYKRTGDTWVQEAYIKATAPDPGDEFGTSVSINANTLIVGATLDDSSTNVIINGPIGSTDNVANNRGSVYIFTRTGSVWSQEAYIQSVNADDNDSFGFDIDIYQDTIVVGVPAEDSSSSGITNGPSASISNSYSSSGATYVYKRTGVNWIQEAYIKPSNNGSNDQFGTSVAIYENTIVVGSPEEDSLVSGVTNGSSASTNNSYSGSGAAYIFERNGSTWSQVAYLKASNSQSSDKFGTSVDIFNNRIIVGAPYEDSNLTGVYAGTTFLNSNGTTNSGAAYLFIKNESGQWEQEAYFKAENTSQNQNFGTKVSISYNALAIAAHGDATTGNASWSTLPIPNDIDAPNAGSVSTYLFKNNQWNFESYNKALNSQDNDKFGFVTKIDDETLIATSPFESSTGTSIINGPDALADNNTSNSGAVYVFRNKLRFFNPRDFKVASTDDNSISLEWIKADNITTGYFIAYQIGDTPPANCSSGTIINVGNVQSYVLSSLQEQESYSFRICSYNGSGDVTVGEVISASTTKKPYEVENLHISNRGYDFAQASWEAGTTAANGYIVSVLTGSTPPNEYCTNGTTTDVGNTFTHLFSGLTLNQDYSIRVCAYNASNQNSKGKSFYIQNGWYFEAYLKSDNIEASDSFGRSISIDGNNLIVGATGEDSNQSTVTNGSTSSIDNSLSGSGAAYLFTRTNSIWTQSTYFKAVSPDASDNYGSSVSIDGDTIAIGATGEDGPGTSITNGPTASALNTSAGSGAVYVYRLNAGNWEQEAYIKSSNSSAGDSFGSKIQIENDTLVVATTSEDSAQTTITNGTGSASDDTAASSGAVYVYKRTGTNWAQEAYIKSSNIQGSDNFGYSVKLNGDYLVVGATGEDSNVTQILTGVIASADNSSSASGAVYLFRRYQATWYEYAYFKSVNSDPSDSFGVSVAVNGDTIAVGASGEDSNSTSILNNQSASLDNSNSSSGAVYVYINNDGLWEQQAYLKPSNSGASDFFGTRIDLSGDTLVVAATGEDNSSNTITNNAAIIDNDDLSSSGAVYVFKRNGTTWSQESYLKSPAPSASDSFGSEITIEGNTIIVSASGEDGPSQKIFHNDEFDKSDSASSSGAVYVFRNYSRLFAPSNFAITSDNGADVTLSWNSVDGATGYKIAYQLGGVAPIDCNSGTFIDVGNVTTHTFTGLSTNDYSFRICSYNATFGDHQGYTLTRSTATGIIYPSDPANFIATPLGTDTINLTWTAAPSANGYKLAYALGDTAPVDCHSGISADLGNVTSTSVNGLQHNSKYSFIICSYNAVPQYSIGTKTSASTEDFPFEISNLRIASETRTNVQLAWTSAGGSTAGFYISYQANSAPANCSTGTVIDAGSATTYNVIGLDSSTEYYFRVCAYDGSLNTTVGRTIARLNGWYQSAYIKAANVNSNDSFGDSVKIDGDTLAISAPYQSSYQTTITNGTGTPVDSLAPSSGAVYIYKKSGNEWIQEAFIKANNAQTNDYFGSSIDLQGDYLIVAAPGEDTETNTIWNYNKNENNDRASDSGSLYVYKRTGTTWAQEAFIKAPNFKSTDRFGDSISIDKDTIVVGVGNEDNSSTGIIHSPDVIYEGGVSSNRGAVYVYGKDGSGKWQFEAYLKIAYDSSDNFGSRVFTKDNLIFVTSPGDDSAFSGIKSGGVDLDDSTSNTGAVLVFAKGNDNKWTHEAFIKASNNYSGNTFGTSISYSNSYLAVGAESDDSNQSTITNGESAASSNISSSNSGAAFVYKRTDNLWKQHAYIKPSNVYPGDNFGHAVSISGNLLAVSAYKQNSKQNFVTNGAGAPSDNLATSSGAVYLYKRINESWNQIAFIKPHNPKANINFGNSVDIKGNLLAIGSNNNDSMASGVFYSSNFSESYGSTNAGAVYIFTNKSDVFDPYELAATPAQNSVTLNWIKAGENNAGYMISYTQSQTPPADCSSGTVVDAGDTDNYTINSILDSRVYSFRVCGYDSNSQLSSGVTITTSTLTSSYDVANLQITARDNTSISLSWDASPAPVTGYRISYAEGHAENYYCNSGTTIDVGNVTSYQLTSLTFRKGYSINVCGIYPLGNTKGALLNAPDFGWYQEAYLKPFANNLYSTTYFGSAISIDGDTVAIGTLDDNLNITTITNSATIDPETQTNLWDGGAVYIYKRTGQNWAGEALIKAFNPQVYGVFGDQISLSGDRLAVSNFTDSQEYTIIGDGRDPDLITNDQLYKAGSVYIYKRTGSTWALEQYIRPPLAKRYQMFGIDISLNEDTIAIGANYDNSSSTEILNSSDAPIDNDDSYSSGATYIYRFNGTDWKQEAYIKATNNDSQDYFGSTVSLKGDLLVVGSPNEDSITTAIINGPTAAVDNNASESGALYVYKRSDSFWEQEAYIKASNSSEGSYYGYSTDIDGNYIVAGIYSDKSNTSTIVNGETSSTSNDGANFGAVFVYKKENGAWKQDAYIKAPNPDTNDYFGTSVAISGQRIAVGANQEDSNFNYITNIGLPLIDNNLEASGAVYTFTRENGLWEYEAFIKSDNPDIQDHFGYMVDLEGDTLIVAAPREDSITSGVVNGPTSPSDNDNYTSGAVYVYRNLIDKYSPANLIASYTDSKSITLKWRKSSEFAGYKIAYVMGSVPQTSCEGSNSTDVGWVDTHTFTNLTPGVNYSFTICGYKASAELSLMQTLTQRTNLPPRGPATLTINDIKTSTFIAQWTPIQSANIQGYRLAYKTGNIAPVNCTSETNLDVGNVQNYKLSGLLAYNTYSIRVCPYDNNNIIGPGLTATANTLKDLWYQESFIKSANNDPFDLFGNSVDIFADTLVVGAPGEDSASTLITSDIAAIDNNDAESSGAVYIYKRNYEDWTLHSFIKSSNSDLGDNFGQVVSIHKDTIAIGAPLEDSSQNTITNAPTSSSDNSVKDSGAVYIYKLINDNWVQEAYLKAPNPDIDDEYGSALDLNENTLVVGAYREDGDQTTIINGTSASATNTSIDSGGAYIYFRTGSSWNQEAYIKAANNDSGNFFARSVSIDGNTVAIGAPKEDSATTTIINGTTAPSNSSSLASGAVYVYKRTGVNWAQESYIKASNNNESDYFASAVSLRGDQLAVGASEEDSNEITITNGATASTDNNALSSGAVYIYERSGSNWTQTAYIKASNANSEDHFGSTLSLGQNTLVVGAKDEDSSQRGITLNSSPLNDSLNSGAAYIYRYNGVNWSQESYLKAINSDANDNFGSSVAMSGDTIAIGSPGESAYITEISNNESASTSNDAQNSGAVYIYRYIGRIFDIVDLRGSIDINTNIKLTWNRLAFAAGYKVSYQTGTSAPIDCNSATQIDVGSVDNYTVTGLTPGVTYSFRVCGYDNTPTYSDGAVVTVTKPNPPPNPTGLAVVANNSKSVTLNWTSGGGSTTGFKVAFNIGTTPPTSCADGTIIDVGNVTTHTEINFPHYSKLSFRVCAYNVTGDLSSGETINTMARVDGWYQEAYIKPNTNEKELFYFGERLDFDGKQIAATSKFDSYLTNETIYGPSVTIPSENSSYVGAVYIFERTGDNWEQKAFIKAPNAAMSDRFGQSVSLFGDRLVVSLINDNNMPRTYFNGKYTEKGNGSSSGAIHVFKKVGATWLPEAFIKPIYIESVDGFANLVRANNDTIIANATGERTLTNYIQNGEQTVDSNSTIGANAGAVYVFRNKGQGWYSESFIKPTNIQKDDFFGSSIAIDGDYLAVGAVGEDSNQTTISNDGTIVENNSSPSAGAAYIFKRTGDTWVQDAYIKAANAEPYDNFGNAIEIKGDYLIVSASEEDSFTTAIINGPGVSTDNSWNSSGAIYVYKKNAGNWEQDAYIKLSNTGVHQEWYSDITSLSIDGDTLAVGNSGDPSIGNIILNGPNASSYGDGNSFWDVGSVFVYRRTAAGWEQEAYIQASNSQLGSQFGENVVIKGDTIVVGSPAEGSSFRSIINGPVTNELNIYSVNSGAIYVYRNKKRLFEASTVTLSDSTDSSLTLSWLTNSGSAIGYKIAYQVGSAPADCNSGTVVDVGNVDTYVLTGLLQNTTYGVRICSYDIGGNDSVGQVYTYITNPSVKEPSDVSIASNTTDSITLTWTDSSPGVTAGFKLAYALGDTAPADCNSGTSVDLGLVTTYTITALTPLNQYSTRLCSYDATAFETKGIVRSARVQSSGWNYKGMLQAPFSDANDNFGTTITMSDKYFVVGHPLEDSNQTTITTVQSQDNNLEDSGAVHVYEKVGNAWQYMSFIKASNSGAGDNFGYAVAIHGDKIVVGVPYESSSQLTITNGTSASSDDSNPKSGAVYVYKNNAGTWVQEAYIKASNNTAGDLFGSSVDIRGSLIAVGSPFEASNQNTITTGSSASSDESSYGSGATYIYTFNGSIWNQTAYIKAANSDFLDKFGHSVAIGNDTHIAVSAIEEDSIESTIINGPTTHLSENGINTGAIYVYEFVAGNWQQQAFIKKINPDSDDRLGETIKFDNDTIVATAPSEDSSLTGVTNGTTASTNNTASGAGAIYVYRKTNGVWAQEAFIKSNSSSSSEDFGRSMDFKGDTIVASAPNEDSDFSVIYNSSNPTSNSSAANSGAVHVFRRIGTTWAQEAMIKSPRNYAYLNFGASVAIHGNQIAVGDPKENGDMGNINNNQNITHNDFRNTNSGAVLFFENNYRVFEVTNIQTSTTSNSITINWNHTSGFNAGYQFAYNVGTTPPADCTSGTIVDAGLTNTYVESSLANATTYAFRICAYDSSLNLSNGVIFNVTTDP